MAAAPTPLPPEIASQASPEQAQSVFSQQGLGKPPNPQAIQVLQQLQQKLQELEKWAGDAKTMLDNYDPSLSVLLQPIAQAGMDLAKALTEKAKQSGAMSGSPSVPANAPQNPAAGPPMPLGA